MSGEVIEEGASSTAPRQKALLHYGSGLLALTDEHGDLLDTMDEVFVVKEKCLHCFLDLNVSLEDDIEEERRFEKTFASTRLKHVYVEENCSNRYHARPNSLIWEEFLQELNMFKQVILLEKLQWLFDTEMTKRLSADVHTIVDSIKSKLVVLQLGDIEEEEEEEKETEEEEKEVVVKEVNTAVEERGNACVENFSYDHGVEETMENNAINEETSIAVVGSVQKQRKRREGGQAQRGYTPEGVTRERKLPLSTLERGEYYFTPAAEGERPLEVVQVEKREEIMTGLDIVITEPRVLKHEEPFHDHKNHRNQRKHEQVKLQRQRKPESNTGGSKWRLTRHGVWTKS